MLDEMRAADTGSALEGAMRLNEVEFGLGLAGRRHGSALEGAMRL